MTSKAAPLVLRTAAVWGTTVLALRSLAAGQSFSVGDGAQAAVPRPEGISVSESPVRAVGKGWELDARGATGGAIYLRGRREDPARLASTGAPIPIVAGDHGLIQYGSFAVFFQFTQASPPIRRGRILDWALVLSFIFSMVAVGGGLALIWAITTPIGIAKPIELTSQAELLAQFNMKAAEVEPPPAVGHEQDDKGKGIKDPGAKDKKEPGGGRKVKGSEGRLGRQGSEKTTEQTGEIRSGLGGMAEVLSSDVGDEVRKTLGTISSVAEALGGLRSDRIVLGQGMGTGLKGVGRGGGGDSDGVPFGAGTLDTGWGAGRGGGLGAGSGGPGARGLAGRGLGGARDGSGSGTGTAEKKVAGKDAPKAGQGLLPNQISRVVMSRYGAFRACYEAAAARDPTMSGNVGVSWSITPGGSVSAATITGSSLGNPRVEGCILRQVNRLRFPRADKATNTSWPFAFRPSRK